MCAQDYVIGKMLTVVTEERSGSVVDCLSRDALKIVFIYVSIVCEQAMKALTDCKGPPVNFSCSTLLSMKIQRLIKPNILKNKDFSCFQYANKC